MFRVYTKEQKSKEVFNYNIDASELEISMGGNIFLDHPELNPDDYIVVSQEQPFTCPIYDAKKNTIDEATREQRILIFKEVELLQDGEYIENEKIISVPAPEEFFKKLWDKEQHIWKEGATEEEIKNFYFSQINKFKSEIMENGFNFNGHQQKCREKDLALLGNAVAALDDMATFSQSEEEKTVNWAFNDNDILLMTETDLRKMRIAGTIFINTIYGVEAELKAAEPNISLKKDEFIVKINELSEFKCYEVVV